MFEAGDQKRLFAFWCPFLFKKRYPNLRVPIWRAQRKRFWGWPRGETALGGDGEAAEVRDSSGGFPSEVCEAPRLPDPIGFWSSKRFCFQSRGPPLEGPGSL